MIFSSLLATLTQLLLLMLDLAFHGFVLAILVWSVCRLCERWLSPQVKVILWGLVLLRLVVPFVPQNEFSIFALLPSTTITDHLVENSVTATPQQFERSGQQLPLTADDSTRDSDLPSHATVLDHQRIAAKGVVSPWNVAAAIWLSGVLVLALRVSCLTWMLARKRTHWKTPTEVWVLDLWSRCLKEVGIREHVELCLAEDISGPGAFGFLRPCVVLPTSLPARMSRSELRHILLHELMHIRRRDLRWTCLAFSATTVQWCNPVAWWAARHVSNEIELACDASVMQLMNPEERLEYGYSILRVVEQFVGGAPVGSVGFGEPARLTQRISRVADFRPTPVLFALVGGALICIVAFVGLTGKPDPSASPSMTESWTEPPEEWQAGVGQHDGDWYTGEDGTSLPLPVEEEQEVAKLIRRFGGWYSLDDDRHITSVNMVYYYDWGPSWQGPDNVDPHRRRSENGQRSIEPLLEALPEISRLSELLLKGSQVTDDSMHHLAGMQELQTLYIWDASRISDVGTKHLAGLSKLKSISIGFGKISDGSLEVFANLPMIERLMLQGNRFSDVGLEQLQRAKNLKKVMLGLGDNTFSDSSVLTLLDLPNIQEVGIQGTELSRRTKAEFKKANVKLVGEEQKRPLNRLRSSSKRSASAVTEWISDWF